MPFIFLYSLGCFLFSSSVCHIPSSSLDRLVLVDINSFLKSFFLCLCVFPTCMSVHHVNAWCSWGLEEGIRSPETGITDYCERPCVCWDQTLSSVSTVSAYLLSCSSISSVVCVLLEFISEIVQSSLNPFRSLYPFWNIWTYL